MSTSQPVNRNALVTAVAISVAGTTAVILGGQALRRLARTRRLKRSVGREVDQLEHDRRSTIERADASDGATVFRKDGGKEKEWAPGEYDENLIREQVSVLRRKMYPEILRSRGTSIAGIASLRETTHSSATRR
jgi:hypothetical protein